MPAVRVSITTSEYLAATFSWYEIFASQTNFALGSVVANAEFSELAFATAFIHPNLIDGETWFYWVRAAYDNGESYSSLRALGSVVVADTGGGSSSSSDGCNCSAVDVAYDNADSGLATTTVQDAIDELAAEILAIGGPSSSDGATGGLDPGTPPVRVQFASSTGSKSATFAIAPTPGSLLLALCKANNLSNGAGWSIIDSNGGGTNYNLILTKIAGGAESTTQTPLFSDDNADVVCIWEISLQNATTPVVFANATVLGSANLSFTCGPGGPATDGTPTSLPGMADMMNFGAIFTDGTTPQDVSGAINMTAEVVNNTATYTHFVAGRSDGATPVAQLLTVLATAIATRACFAVVRH
jgi:hypothetical protein